MTKSKIEWTDRTWNPTVGCARVSPGCENCYAENQAARVVLMSAAQGRESVYLPVVDVERRRWNRACVTVPGRLEDPLRWKKPAMVFVNSMSDLFHPSVPFEFIAAVFGVAAACPQHTFQILTKRPQRMREFFAWLGGRRAALRECFLRASTYIPDDGAWKRWVDQGRQAYDCGFPWPLPNVWLGVSVEDQQRADERIPVLLECPAAVRFLSCEPLLGEVDINATNDVLCRCYGCMSMLTQYPESPSLRRIDWVIVGGESGPGARECDLAWVRSIVEQCAAADVPVFVKQLGAKPTVAGRRVISIRDRKGADPSEWPTDLRVQQFPGGAK